MGAVFADSLAHDHSKQSRQIEAKRYESSGNDDEAVDDQGRAAVSLAHNI